MNGAVRDGPWILNCNYCMWTSLDIGIKFDRSTNIRAQLDKIANGGIPKAPSKPSEAAAINQRSSYLSRQPYPQTSTGADDLPATHQEDPVGTPSNPAARFAALKSFYKNQIATTTTDDSSISSISGDFSYSSPASLARIMNLYSTSGSFQPKKKAKTPVMREALYPSEGLLLADPHIASITQAKILSGSFSNAASLEQRHFQTGPGGGNPDARFVDELRPMPAPLTTKRAKRCKECRHIIVKPEAKPTSTRHRINLVALSYIPHVSLKPLAGTGLAVPSTGPSALFGGDVVLESGNPTQWILTLKNPLFDAVKVSIATPAITPGKHGHRVTILCPQFQIGANSDVWDEALNPKSSTAMSVDTTTGMKSPGGGGNGAAEAGKVYEKGRNWTSVVLEVVPVDIVKSTREAGEEGQVREDEDVLEIPFRVRLEWRQGDLDDAANKEAMLNEETGDNGRRELAYWMVLGVGRVKA